ncbi:MULTISPECIES: hypothetical protein [Streptomyces]|uniref:Secreted protein n=1 Tax=Streptomyces viridochromogenes TaxID=1938 RepID=A0A0L8JFZ0_STRVR|nr:MULTISPECIES: hypothetical protein [Streptomyces]KOG12469.1 hypothetical protein ADK34_32035 [Streptomyces viridochromogenes]
MRPVPSLRPLLAAAVLVCATVMVTATPANAATCPHRDSPKIPAGEADWTLTCRQVEGQSALYVDGWVEDTRRDTLCAVVRITPEGQNHPDEVRACGYGERVQIHEFYKGRSAIVRLAGSR